MVYSLLNSGSEIEFMRLKSVNTMAAAFDLLMCLLFLTAL